MRLNGKLKLNYPRRSLQGITILLLAYLVLRPIADKNYVADFEAYCPFGGVQALSAFLVKNVLACSMTTVQIALGIALLTGAALGGKLFCSYICPVGTFTEWLGRLGGKWNLIYAIPATPDKMLRSLKYILLVLVFYFTITSGELFCKKFDPYYATFTGFGSDVKLLYAAIAMVITVVGSVFIRQFWCRYLCPLGALTNISANLIPLAAVVMLFLILKFSLLRELPWVWFLLAIAVTGFTTEILHLQNGVFPLLKITRKDSICTHCRICDKVCPMAIRISGMEKVTHVDCHLCGDCLAECPEAGALSINRRKLSWLPVAIIVGLVVTALYLSSVIEIPTINERWGSQEAFKTAKEFKMTGLTGIKCFGSSSSFATQMKSVPGILGVETYVKQHRVKVFYDPSRIDETGIKEAIFTPVSVLLNYPPSLLSEISVIKAGLGNFFDTNDENILADRLRLEMGVLGMSTSFGEPVKLTVYYDPSRVSPDRIKQLIEIKEEHVLADPSDGTRMAHFTLAFMINVSGKITLMQFMKAVYEPVDVSFNGFDSIPAADLAICQFAFPQGVKSELMHWVPFLLSHSSNDNGVVRFQAMFNDDLPVLRIWYIRRRSNPGGILKLLNAPLLKVYYPDGTQKSFKNVFAIEGPGEVLFVK
jgi:polyferredoxin